ncbi:MAG TPA: DUF2867 domain-containing protein, partial [Anaerolineales bacterium]|nr:DUF2867 domain-containing protein [Anaerolineales bacterium]
TELFPIVPGPLWMKNKSQPIAIQNVIDYLFAALTNPNGRGQVFEIGGPDIMKYGDLMLRYARIRGLKRRLLLLPGIPLWFMALGIGLMTPVSYPIAYALIYGLSADSVVKHPETLKVFPEVKLIDFEAATKEALKKTHPAFIERIWEDGEGEPKSIKHEGCFIDHREVIVATGSEKLFRTLVAFNEKRNWAIEVDRLNQQVMVCVKNQVAGNKWIEWRVLSHAKSVTYVTQTVFFCPRGLPGFLYWYLLYPFHVFSFRGLIKSITKQSDMQ